MNRRSIADQLHAIANERDIRARQRLMTKMGTKLLHEAARRQQQQQSKRRDDPAPPANNGRWHRLDQLRNLINAKAVRS